MLIFKRKAALLADALVADAAQAKPVLTTEEGIRQFWAAFPGPSAKAKTCPFCGGFYITPCKQEEHAQCRNVQTAEHRKKRMKL